jgi:GSCFA family
MNFRTELKIQADKVNINHQNQILSLGSCFADRIGGRLKFNKFNISANPFGVIFNPISLNRLIGLSLQSSGIDPKLCVERDERIYHYDLHSSINEKSQNLLIQQSDSIIQEVHHFLKNTDLLILTWGTAWVYELPDEHRIVANCHKQPASFFAKRLLELEEILADFDEMFTRLHSLNPRIRVLLTVSPVRHLKDTIPLNSLSKAVLRLACHKICTQYEAVSYFPSYELVMDDLRDYRFYASDMIHPNEVAEDYIWLKFSDGFFDLRTQDLLKKWNKIHHALNHRPFNPQGKSYQDFLENTLNELRSVAQDLPVEHEIQHLQNILNEINSKEG